MVRSFALTGSPRHVASVMVLLAAFAGGTAASEQSAAVDIAPHLNRLIEQGAAFENGTYVVTDRGIEPDATTRPLVVQADIMRGSERTIRAAIVLGADVPQPYQARIRVLRAGAAGGGAVSVAGDERGAGQAGKTRFIRELTLAPGEYEIHGALASARAGGGATVVFNKVRLVVPDVWQGSLAVTPIVLGDAVTTIPSGQPLRPFDFEPTALTPTVSARVGQSDQLHVAYRIYNWAPDQNARPDLAVAYVFYELTPRGPRFFNKIKPQHLDAETLGTLDLSAGAVTAGVSVPLVSFPFGEFELIVRVTDNRSSQSAESRIRFSVAP